MKVIPVAVIGKGGVGRAVVAALLRSQSRAQARGVNLFVNAIAGHDGIAVSREGWPEASLVKFAAGAGDWRDLTGVRVCTSHAELVAAIGAVTRPGQIVVDVSAAESAAWHLDWLRRGWHVVTANKKPLTASRESYEAIMAASRQVDGPRHRHEATCGAGLPIISTIADLLAAGDEIQEISAAASGTLGFVFSACQAGRTFAAAVADAKARGYTEPDPREDLSGKDVARKALILARLLGWSMELSDIPVDDLVPKSLQSGSVENFLAGLPTASGYIDERVSAAAKNGQVLRYLATVGPAGITVGLREVPRESPLGGLAGTENMFVVRSRYYDSAPLVIRGPGAGATVTAVGILSDIFRIINL